ncbi:M14 family metallopeptidase [Paludibaculum fermentans]|uniref:Succinylglutamate desuccinylase/aspartoacylase family protein n=1 Tax=Paludibaculum fermentans TaxID=1473598 RepID=A0A7S7NTQ5_PALFE|nr:succinylglutamate desuccinylase/aspartoacylase family protein [Paludibaculum fermentans]QOY89580.1 succinylglutamate desuccinylase/aspartoacylase family protein [Paludibaculum fermentans]
MTESPILLHDLSAVDFDTPGKRHYQLGFHLDSAWGYSLVPLTVVRGAAGDAPGVAVNGGTHGNEYEGQVAVKRLCADLDPAAMSGLVVLIPQLSESACRAGTRLSPLDNVNMNRAFPGNAKGTISYRIANFLKTQVFPRVKVVIDIHSGGREAVFPLCTSFHRLPDAAQFAEIAKAARLFDTPFLFVYSRQMSSGLLTDEAEDDGKIAIGGEFGSGELVSPEGVQHAYEGSLNVMREYGLLPGPVRPSTRKQRLIQAPDLDDYRPCPRDGIWEALAVPGEEVAQGQLLGRLHDFSDHTAPALEIRAHRAGVLIARYAAAVCPKGLTLFVIGEETEFPA